MPLAVQLQHIACRVSNMTSNILALAMLVQVCCRSFMLWSVNNGGGYPYPNGTDIARYVSSSDLKLLDTNGDGSITQADDPYAPYYPVSMPVLSGPQCESGMSHQYKCCKHVEQVYRPSEPARRICINLLVITMPRYSAPCQCMSHVAVHAETAYEI